MWSGVGTNPAKASTLKRNGKSLDAKTLEALKPRAALYCVSDGGGLLL
jgi:hypothetical protein